MRKSHLSKPLSGAAFDQRLKGYSATAAVVAAVPAAMMVAVTPTAHAAITNITDFKIGSGTFGATPPSATGSIYVHFSAASVGHAVAFAGSFKARSFGGENFAFVGVGNHAGVFVEANSAAGTSAINVAQGAAIEGNHFNNGGQQLFATRHAGGSAGFNFLPNGANAAVTGYMGFRHTANGHTYYGWLRVKVTNDASGQPDEVSLVAKNGDPGIFGAYGLASDNITAGEVSAIPEPSSVASGLALLALGAAGVREMRRRKTA